MLGRRHDECIRCLFKTWNNRGAFDENGCELSFDEALRKRLVKCFKPNGCANTYPTLDPDAERVFELFVSCQSLFDRSEMSGIRTRIPRGELEVEARLRGYELTEWDLDLIAVMERELRNYDRELFAAAKTKTGAPTADE